MTVMELFDTITPRLQAPLAESLLPALNAVAQHIGKQLRLNRLELAKAIDTVQIVSGNSVVALPPECKILAENPCIVGELLPLQPVDNAKKRTYAGQTGQPKYYAKIGGALMVYPTPDATYDLNLEYFIDPDQLTSTADELPYNGLFDLVFVEATVMVMQKGRAMLLTQEVGNLILLALKEIMDNDEQMLANALNGYA